jgi:enamine deaminase RidA (YjgF/YER057c/UK114 family)
MGQIETRLAELGLDLPPLPKPGGNYAPGVLSGSQLHLSGAIGTACRDGKWSLPIAGKLGAEVSVEQGRESARYCVLNHLAAAKAVIGDLDRIARVVKLTGYVNAAPGFTKAPLVLDGASDLLVAVFGSPAGLHARVAAYQHEMSFNAPLETELLLEIKSG